MRRWTLWAGFGARFSFANGEQDGRPEAGGDGSGESEPFVVRRPVHLVMGFLEFAVDREVRENAEVGFGDDYAGGKALRLVAQRRPDADGYQHRHEHNHATQSIAHRSESSAVQPSRHKKSDFGNC